MLKKIFFAAAVTGLMVATVPVQAKTAMTPDGMSCKEAAKMQGDDRKARHEFKKACKKQYKAMKKGGSTKMGLLKGGLFKKKDAAA